MASQKQARKGKAEPTSEPVAFGISCVYSDLCVFFPPKIVQQQQESFRGKKALKSMKRMALT